MIFAWSLCVVVTLWGAWGSEVDPQKASKTLDFGLKSVV